MQKYKQNLSLNGIEVKSYNTLVGLISNINNKLYIWDWYSVTTSKHINYVANELGLIVEKVKDYQTANSLASNL